jgi:thiol-disulfide isomerase/thioredoxin
MKKLYILLLLLGLGFQSQAQLPDGSKMPDITVTDINGQTHRLYDYLDSGKVVIIDIFATWCPPCWFLHENHVLKDLWEAYGPDGTDQLVIFSIEGDDLTTNADLNGTGDNTVGDWVTGVPYYIVEDSSVPAQFNLAFWPTIFVIRPSGSMILANDYCFANVLDPSFDYVYDVAFRGPNDAALSANYSTRYFCGTYQQGSFVATVKNMGSDTLTSATVKLFVNGEEKRTKDWTGTLTEFKSANVTLTGLAIEESSEMYIEVSVPNGQNDGQPGDNLYGWNVTELQAQQTAKLTITTDFWPEEVSWTVKDNNGVIIASSADLGTLECDQTYEQEFLYTTTGCYEFKLVDGFGDGLLNGPVNPSSHSCTTPNGQASNAMGAVSLELDGNVVYDNISYGAGVTVPFNFDSATGVEDITSISGVTLYPNPVSDNLTVEFNSDLASTIRVTAVDIMGRTVKNFGAENLVRGDNQLQLNVSNLVSGTYFLRITQDDAVKTMKFEKL